MTFRTPSAMHYAIMSGKDLYSPELETYVFSYNDEGSICEYRIRPEEAYDLAQDAEMANEYWSAFLGLGGGIYDEYSNQTPMDFCKEFYTFDWIETKDVIDYYFEKGF